MAGISHATLVIEAGIISGTLITSKYATDYNRDVGAIPGSIFSKLSEGPHMLIRLGATPIISSDNVLEMLGLKSHEYSTESLQKILPLNISPTEKTIMELLNIEPCSSEQLVLKSEISAKEINEALSKLEIGGFIVENFGKFKLV